MKVKFGLKGQIYFSVLYKIFSKKLYFSFFETKMLTFTVRNILWRIVEEFK